MRRRIVVLYLILAVIASSVVAFVSYRYSSTMYVEEIESGLRHEVILIEQILSKLSLDEIDDGFLKQLSATLASEDDQEGKEIEPRRITLIATDGLVLADSSVASASMENHADRTEFINALKNGTGSDIRESETTRINRIYYAYYSKDLDLVVRVSGAVQYINNIRNTILLYSVIAVLLAMVISVFMALSLSKYIVKPVVRLVKEYSGAIPEKDGAWREKDEIKQLSLTLSSITQNIEDTINELQERNARVNTIISSMDSGLIAVDRTMNIIMINPVAYKLFEVQGKLEHTGIPLVQIIRNRQINDILLKSITGNKAINGEIYLYQKGKRIFSVHAVPIHNVHEKAVNSGALVYITDITQVRKLEEMRSEFVSNVTHELKTPLTSIQGFVETLKNGAISDPTVSEKFLDIIDIETDRLRMLINDILELSEIENIKQDNDTEVFELFELIKEVESMLEAAALEKEIAFDIQVNPGLNLKANRNRMKQLLINLMDNAIKYNRLGGSVLVTGEKLGNQVEIHVKDTGIGISEEHIGRIFERFYRVDKGRSREMGGTGLGLSIVKHIAQLYGGRVRAESREDKGSDFIVTLPANVIV